MSKVPAFLWRDTNGDWWGFSPAYHWICGEKREHQTLPDPERRRLLIDKLTRSARSSTGTPQGEVELVHLSLTEEPPPASPEKRCAECSEPFTPRTYHQKFCGAACRRRDESRKKAAQYVPKTKRTTKVCAECGETFLPKRPVADLRCTRPECVRKYHARYLRERRAQQREGGAR